MPPLRPEEQWARQLMAAELGAVVDQHDDQSQDSMYDLKVTYPDGTIAAAEVVAAADADSIELWNLVNSNGRRIYHQLVGGWTLSLRPTARAKQLFEQLPDFLHDLEQRDVAEVPTRRRSHLSPDPDRDRAADLGIIHAFQSGTKFRGSVYFIVQQAPDRTGGFVSGSDPAVAEWVSEFLCSTATTDVLGKLARSGLSERHVFVILPAFTTAPFVVFGALWSGEDDTVPEASPSLPSQVTHVWLISVSAAASGLRWSANGGWRRFAVAPPLAPDGT
jgi:hypothetical protein